MKPVNSLLTVGFMALSLGLPINLFGQDHQEHEENGGDCLTIEGRLFDPIRIPGETDFHPGDIHGGVVLKGRDDAILLYLRTGGKYKRAQYTAKELNNLFNIGHTPDFEVVPPHRHPDVHGNAAHPKSTNHWSIFVALGGDHPHEIVWLLPGDISGYRYRAPGGKYHDESKTQGLDLKEDHEITGELVVNWWLANLQDLCSMFICGKEPTNTAGTFAGEIYSKIYHEGRELHPEGAIEIDEWLAVLQDLTFRDRNALRRAGQFIPEAFGENHHDDH